MVHMPRMARAQQLPLHVAASTSGVHLAGQLVTGGHHVPSPSLNGALLLVALIEFRSSAVMQPMTSRGQLPGRPGLVKRPSSALFFCRC